MSENRITEKSKDEASKIEVREFETSKFETSKGHLAAIICNILYGLTMNITKSLYASSWMTPMGYSFVRILFGLVLYWILSLFTAKEKIAPRDLVIILTAGFLGMVVTQIVFSVGLKLISPVTMSLIGAMFPIVVLILSVIFAMDTFTLPKTIGVVIGIAGAAIVVLGNRDGGLSSASIVGIILAFISVLAQAIYYIIMKKVSGKYSPVTMMKWMFMVGLIFLAPLCLRELPSQRIFSREVTLLPVLQLAFALIFGCALAVFLLPVALKRITATAASMYNNLQPLVASTAAIIIGQDFFTWDKPLALLLIIGGVFLVTYKKPLR